MIPELIFIGGFLGAGKTTLILKAAQIFRDRGQRSAIIMNDQDSELVDTKFARANHFETAEVAGGCFCCRFSDLLDQAKNLLAYNPDVIFAEPVGSCIDLSATILRPFLEFHADLFTTAPLTVLIDPDMAQRVLSGDATPEIEYLFHQQIREADIICTTKADLYPLAPEFLFPVDFHISALSGLGVEEWLSEVITGGRITGARLLDVDYQEYADAEAALGWLNIQISICTEQAISPAGLIGPLLEKLDALLTAQNIEIVHLKLFDQTRHGYLVATIRTNGEGPVPRGDLLGEATLHHEIAINLRAVGDARPLQAIAEKALSEIAGSISWKHCRAFQPLPPKPEHRIAQVVKV